MGKLKRGALIHHVKKAGGETWHLIGKDIDTLSVDMNGSFETTKNILDETSVKDKGYEPSISVTPYYANPDDGEWYEFLKDLAMNRKSGDDAKAVYLETLVEKAGTTGHSAWQEDCIIEIASYGGGTEGTEIAYNIHPDGNRKVGTVSLAAGKVPTFSEGLS